MTDKDNVVRIHAAVAQVVQGESGRRDKPENASRALMLAALQARVAYPLVQSDRDEAYCRKTWRELDARLAAADNLELLAVIQDLMDVAWDLADAWARDSEDVMRPLNNLRLGHARGW